MILKESYSPNQSPPHRSKVSSCLSLGITPGPPQSHLQTQHHKLLPVCFFKNVAICIKLGGGQRQLACVPLVGHPCHYPDPTTNCAWESRLAPGDRRQQHYFRGGHPRIVHACPRFSIVARTVTGLLWSWISGVFEWQKQQLSTFFAVETNQTITTFYLSQVPIFRSYRPQIRASHLRSGLVDIHLRLWALDEFLGSYHLVMLESIQRSWSLDRQAITSALSQSFHSESITFQACDFLSQSRIVTDKQLIILLLEITRCSLFKLYPIQVILLIYLCS